MNMMGGMGGGNRARMMTAAALRGQPMMGMPVQSGPGGQAPPLPGTDTPRPRQQGGSWGWKGPAPGAGGGQMTQMGFGDALSAMLNGVSGGPTPKGFTTGPAAAGMIKGYQPGDVRAVASKGWSSPFNMPKKTGKA